MNFITPLLGKISLQSIAIKLKSHFRDKKIIKSNSTAQVVQHLTIYHSNRNRGNRQQSQLLRLTNGLPNSYCIEPNGIKSPSRPLNQFRTISSRDIILRARDRSIISVEARNAETESARHHHPALVRRVRCPRKMWQSQAAIEEKRRIPPVQSEPAGEEAGRAGLKRWREPRTKHSPRRRGQNV